MQKIEWGKVVVRVIRSVSIVLVLCWFIGNNSNAFGFNWSRFSGSQVRFLACRHAWSEAIEPFISEFEKKTGIKVQFEIFPEDQFRQKLLIEFASGSSTIDGFMVMPRVTGRQYYKSGWVYPLDDFLKDPSFTDSGYDFYEDFTRGAQKTAVIEGKTFFIPIVINSQVLWYRRDLFEQFGLNIPDSMTKMEIDACKLTRDIDGDGRIDIYGISNRGRGPAAVSQCAAYIYNMGATWLDENRNPAFNSAEGIVGFDLYGRLLRNYGPPGALNNSWMEAVSIFAQGRAAMMTDANSLRKSIVDPTKSKIVDKFGVAMVPKGPAGTHPLLSSWNVAIAMDSKNKGATWYLIQWMSDKRNTLRALLAGNAVGRKSVWQSSQFKQNDKYPEWTKVTLEAQKYGNVDFQPPVVAVGECKDIIGKVITASILGENVRKAANEAAIKMKEVMKRTE